MRKCIILAAALCMIVSVFSVEKQIVIGGSADESSNINRSKDSAFIPPSFGSPECVNGLCASRN